MSLPPQTGLRVPSVATLKKYGLTEYDWFLLALKQGGQCFVCLQTPSSGVLHIDHDHVPKWKKLPPQERKRHVRGLLCFRCNTTYVGRSITVDRAKRVVQYLQRYADKQAREAK